MSFNAKNLHYDKNEPTFLKRLRTQYSNENPSDRESRQRNAAAALNRPAAAKRLLNDPDEDEPTYVDEESHEVVSREEYREMVERGKVGEGEKGDAKEGGEGEEKGDGLAVGGASGAGGAGAAAAAAGKQAVTAEIGGFKRKKQIKVIGDDDDDDDNDDDDEENHGRGRDRYLDGGSQEKEEKDDGSTEKGTADTTNKKTTAKKKAQTKKKKKKKIKLSYDADGDED